ncbi:MAG: FHA domain-containing protein [Cyanobacteria bacterium J06639_18]
MSKRKIFKTLSLNLELFHLQSYTSFDLVPDRNTIRIGRVNEEFIPEINLSKIAHADVVSRIHAAIKIQGNTYYLEDLGSANGTFLNNVPLEPNKIYPLRLGDRIDLCRENKVTFIFQYKQQYQPESIAPSSTIIQSKPPATSFLSPIDPKMKFIGLAMMVAGIIIISANIRISILVSIPSLLILIAGVVLLLQNRINRNWGWLPIAIGIVIMLFTNDFPAPVNLLAILISSTLLFIGHQLYTNGKVLDYDLNRIKKMFNTKRH